LKVTRGIYKYLITNRITERAAYNN
jgi:hypothetical protein